MSRSFDDILNTCLDRITLKRDTVEQCLETYPECAAELEPLLRSAVSLREAAAVEPRSEFTRMARARLLSAVEAKRATRPAPSSSLLAWQQRWALAAIAVLAIIVIGGGTLTASASSLPGDILYPVKTAAEKVEAFFTFGDRAKAKLCIRLAERRVQEVEALAARTGDIPSPVLRVMGAETGRAVSLIGQSEASDTEAVTILVDLTWKQKVLLVRLVQQATPEQKLHFRAALTQSEAAHNQALALKGNLPYEQEAPLPQATPQKTPVTQHEATPPPASLQDDSAPAAQQGLPTPEPVSDQDQAGTHEPTPDEDGNAEPQASPHSEQNQGNQTPPHDGSLVPPKETPRPDATPGANVTAAPDSTGGSSSTSNSDGTGPGGATSQTGGTAGPPSGTEQGSTPDQGQSSTGDTTSGEGDGAADSSETEGQGGTAEGTTSNEGNSALSGSEAEGRSSTVAAPAHAAAAGSGPQSSSAVVKAG